MPSYNAKVKNFFILLLCIPLLSGCARKADLREQTKENKIEERGQPTSNWAAETQTGKPLKILFVGDMMFDRYIRQTVEKRGNDYGYIFSGIRDFLEQFDLVVGNLEGPLTDKTSVSVGTATNEKKNLIFSFDPAVAKTLFENNIKLVSLGNNHILNQGDDGLAQTKKYLDEAGVEYFGDTGTSEVVASEANQSREYGDGTGSPRFFGSRENIIKNIGAVKIGFVNYNYSVDGSFEKAVGDVRNIKNQADLVIVFPHWGTEYKMGDPGERIKTMAHQLIEAGADLIVGTHPHVVQTSEVYNGKKIYYSLGNFVFDQYFSRQTMEGLAVEVEISPKDKSLNFQEIPVRMEKSGKTEISRN